MKHGRLGMTLVETAVSLVIVAMTVLGVSMLITSTIRANSRDARTLEANQIAERLLEEAVATILDDTFTLTTCPDVTTGFETGRATGTEFGTSLTITPQSLDLNTGDYHTNCAATDLYQLDANVTWGEEQVSLSTLASSDPTFTEHPIIEAFTLNEQTDNVDMCVTSTPREVRLAWDVAAAATVTLTLNDGTPIPLDEHAGARAFTVTETTRFTLTAQNAGGAISTDRLTAFVDVLPTVSTFSLSPNPTVEGVPSTLTWSVSDAKGLFIDDVPTARLSGTREAPPVPGQSYTLKAINGGCVGADALVQDLAVPLEVLDLEIEELTAADNPVTAGTTTSLGWTYSDPISPTHHTVTLTNSRTSDQIDVTGVTYYEVTSQGPTTYTLTITGPNGSVLAQKDTLLDTRPPAIIDAFDVEPAAVCGPQPITATWATQNAVRLTLEPLGVDVTGMESVTLPLEASADLHLEASNELGARVASSSVFVRHAPEPTATFNTSSSRINEGGTATLTWSVQNGETITVNGHPVDREGAWTVAPDTTTYTLVVTQEGCEDFTQSVTIAVDPLEFTSISITPEEVTVGEGATLTWALNEAFDPSLHRFVIQPGSIDVGDATSYTITTTQPGVTTLSVEAFDRISNQPITPEAGVSNTSDRQVARSASTTLTVIEQPEIVAFTSEEAFVCGPSPITVHWETRFATTAKINGVDITPADAGSGQINITAATPPLVLETYNRLGYRVNSIPIAIRYHEIPTATFTKSRDITKGDSATLRWSTQHTTRVTLDGTPVDAIGEVSVAPLETTTYTLEYQNGTECAPHQQTVTIEVTPVKVESFTTDHTDITRGDSTTLRWSLIPSFDPSLHTLTLAPLDQNVTAASNHVVSPIPPLERYTLIVTDHQEPPREIARSNELTVIVDEAPAVTNFQITPPSVCGANDVTLAWNTMYATKVMLNNETVAFNNASRTEHIDRDRDFTLRAENRLGAADTVERSVAFEEYPVVNFAADKTGIVEGDQITLTWDVTGADRVTLGGEIVPANGTRVLTPRQDTSYELIATKNNGATPEEACITPHTVDVTVEPVSIAQFGTNASVEITRGDTLSLPWELEGPFTPAVHTLTLDTLPSDGSDATSVDVTDLSVLDVRPAITTDYRLTLKGIQGQLLHASNTRAIVIDPPVITRFTADPELVCGTGEALLAWETTGATSLHLNDEPLQSVVAGNTTKTITSTTTFELTARNHLGASITARRTIQRTPAPTATFTTSSSRIGHGDSITLAWDAQHATRVRLDGRSVDPSGTLLLSPDQTTTYELVVEGDGCAPLTRTLTVTVDPVTVTSLHAEPATITVGDTSTLTWDLSSTFDAALHVLTLEPTGEEITSATHAVTPRESSSYRLRVRARNNPNRILASSNPTTITVQPRPVIDAFRIDPENTCGANAPITLSWATRNASIVRLDGTLVDPNGTSDTFVQSDADTFTLEARNALGARVTRTISSTHVQPPTLTFEANTETIVQGQAATLTWSTGQADLVTLDGQEVPAVGNRTVTPNETTTYELRATRRNATTDCAEAYLITIVVEPLSIDAFTATPASIPASTSSTLAWSTTPSSLDPTQFDLTLEPLGINVTTLSEYEVTPKSPTRYWLALRNTHGTLLVESERLTLAIDGQPALTQATITPEHTCSATNATLAWDSVNAAHVLIDGVQHPASGTLARYVTASQQFILTPVDALGKHGNTETATIRVAATLDTSLTATDTTITRGGSTRLAWNAGATTRATLNGVDVALAGEQVVRPLQTTTYRLVTENGDCVTTRAVTVTVKNTSITSFQSDTSDLTRGEAATLTWSVTNFDPTLHTLTLQPSGTVLEAGTGSITVEPTSTTHYSLVLTGATGRTLATRALPTAIRVHEAPIISAFTAEPARVCGTQDITFRWGTQHASLVTLNGVEVTPRSAGVVTRTITEPSDFVLTATNPAGASVTSEPLAILHAPATSATLSATHDTVPAGTTTTLTWDATGQRITLNGETVAASGSIEIAPQQTTTYTLTAYQDGCASSTSIVTITVEAARITSFTSDATNLRPGDTATLNWDLSAAFDPDLHQLLLEPTGQDVTTASSVTVTPSTSTTYQLVLLDRLEPQRELHRTHPGVTLVLEGETAIISFTSDPVGLCEAGPVTFSWTTVGASRVTLDAQDVTPAARGSSNLTLSTGRSVDLVVFDASGTPATTRTLTVPLHAPSAASLTLGKQQLVRGESTTLTWDADGAQRVTLNGEAVPASGSRAITPTSTTTYTLHASNPGQPDCGTSESVTVTVDEVAIENFSVDKTRIQAGESVTFTWTLGSTVTPDQHQVILEGHDALYPDETTFPTSLTLTPSATRTYRLTVLDAIGHELVRSSDITIHVHHAPTIEAFTATPASICGASDTLLTWGTTHATNILLDGLDVSTNAGQLTRRLEPGATLTLTARNEHASVTRDLTVPGTPRPTISFHASPLRRVAGEEATITWSVQDADTVRLNGEIVEPAGTRSDWSGTTTSYILEVTGGLDCAPITQERVIVTEPVRVDTLTADHARITEGDTTTLRWSTSRTFNPNLHVLTLESTDPENPFEENVTSLHALDVTPLETTTYQLRISNQQGDTLALGPTATITVEGYPAITRFEADPIRTCGPQDVTFTWGTLNAARVTLNDNDVMPTSAGSHTLTNNATTDYVLAAINPLGVTVTSDPITIQHAQQPILTFTSDKTTITDGDAVTLQWKIQHASGGTLDGQAVSTSGSLTVHPTQTTTYTLVADNAAAGAPCVTEKTLTVTVNPVEITSFTATPAKVTIGDAYDLAWAFSSTFDPALHTVHLDAGSSDLSNQAGSTLTANATTTHTLMLARRHDGSTIDTATTTMTAYPAPLIDRFSSNPATLCTPESATITWETRHANRITFATNGGTPNPIPATGNTVVQPSSTSTYAITATNPALTSITRDLTIPVSTRPVLNLQSADTRIPQGGKTTLTWTVQHADAVRLNGTAVPASGSLDINPLETTTYTLEADRIHCGTLSKSVTVQVNPLEITSLTATPKDVTVGESSQLDWTLNNTFDASLHTFTITPAPIDAASNQSASVTPAGAGNTTYTLTARDPYGRILTTRAVTVRAVLAPIIDTFTAEPARVCAYPGGPQSLPSSLTWSVRNAERLDINGGTVAPPKSTSSGTHPVTVGTSTNFTLGAFNQLGYTVANTPITVEHVTAVNPTFTTSRARITAGDTATLTWNGNGASVTLDGQAVPANGSVTVAPLTTTTYKLSTVTSDCEPVERTVTVQVDPVSVTGFSIDRNNVTRGDSARLAWTLASTFDAALHKLVLEPIGQDVTNVASTNVTPTTNTTYRLRIQDRQATPRVLARSSTITLTVNEMPAISSFTVEPSLVCGARDVTLSWATAHASNLALNGMPLSPIANGTATRTVTTNTTYTLAATNPAGTTVSEQRNVTFVPAIQASFASTSTHISHGESIKLSWNVANATNVTLDGQAVTNSGARTLAPTSTTTYTLVANDPDCPTITRKITVQVDPVTIDAFTYTASKDAHGSVAEGDDVNFQWDLSASFKPSVHKLTLNGVDVTSSTSLTEALITTTTYTLRLYDRADPANLLDEANVQVYAQPVAYFSNPPPTEMCEGSSHAYLWGTRHANKVTLQEHDSTITLFDGSLVNSLEDMLVFDAFEDTALTLTASNPLGSTATATHAVDVTPLPIIKLFRISTSEPVEGAPYTITWTVNNAPAGTITLDGQVVDASGIITHVANNDARTHELRVEAAPCASIVETRAVTPTPVQIENFQASKNPITHGSSTTLTWTHGPGFDNALHRVQIDPAKHGGTNDAGTATSHTVTPLYAQTTDYYASIYARRTGELLYRSDAVDVQVVNAPLIDGFAADPAAVCSATPNVALAWATTHATVHHINQGIGNVAADGNTIVAITGDTTWTLTATNAAGDAVTRTASVTLHDPPTISTFTSSTGKPVLSQPYTLSWTTSSNTTRVTLDGVELPAGTTQVQRTANSLGAITHIVQVANAACAGETRTLTLNPITVPGTPGMPTAVNGGDRRITTSWAAPSTNGNSSITGYRIQRRVDGGSWATLVTDTSSSTTTYTDTAVMAGSTYTYRVAGRNAAGIGSNSAASNTVTAITTASAPSKPTLNGTLGNQRIPLAWTAPSSDGHSALNGYRIQRQTSSDGTTWSSWSTLVSNTGSTSVTYTNTGLTAGTYYRYRVAALNAAGVGAYSSASTSMRAITTTNTPAAPTIDTIGDTLIELRWTAPSDTGYGPIRHYRIERQTSSDATTWGGWTAIESHNGGTTSHADSGVTPGTYYRYRIAAINDAGTSATSAPSEAARAITVPATPGKPSITAGDKTFSLTWAAPASDGYSSVTGYSIEMRWHDEGGAWSAWASHVSDTGSTNSAFTTDNGRQPGRYYQFRVAAINAAGVGPFGVASDEAQAITTPGAPTDLAGSATGPLEITLAWAPPASDGYAPVTTYAVRRANASGGKSYVVYFGPNLTYIDTDVAAGSTYRYTVLARNSVGYGPSSAPVDVMAVDIPGAPGMPTLDSLGDQSATISWTAPSSDGGSPIVGYRIQVLDAPTLSTDWYTRISNTGNSSLTAEVSGLTAGSQFAFRVAAINEIGIGPDSEASGTVTTITTPEAPLMPFAEARNSHHHFVGWGYGQDDGGSPIMGYRLEHQRFVNHAANATVTGTITHDTGTAEQVVDGNANVTNTPYVTFDTRGPGASGTNPEGSYVQLDLGSVVPVSIINTYFYAFDSRHYWYKVKVSDNGIHWNYLEGHANNTTGWKQSAASNSASEGDLFPETSMLGEPIMARYVRLFADGNSINDKNHIYEIEVYGPTGLEWEHAKSDVTTTATSVDLNDLAAGDYYRYRVAAVNAAGHSSFSPPSTPKRVGTTPSAPSKPTVTSLGNQSVAFEWDPPADNGYFNTNTYRIQYQYFENIASSSTISGMADHPARVTDGVARVKNGDYASFGSGNGSGTGSETNYIQFDLGSSKSISAIATYWYAYNARHYYYKIKVSEDGTNWTYLDGGPGSSEWAVSRRSDNVTTGEYFPTITEVPDSINARYVRLYANGSTANHGNHIYELMILTPQTAFKSASTTSNTNYNHTGRTAGMFYRHRIAAENSIGVGAYSTPSATKGIENEPGAPTTVTVERDGDRALKVSWGAASSDGFTRVTGYRVQYRYISSGSWTGWSTLISNTTGTSTNRTGLTAGRTYQFRVAAINDHGVGAYKASSSLSATARPGAPSSVTGANYGDQGLRVTWGAADANGASATGYRIQRRINSGSWSTLVSNTGSTSRSYIDRPVSGGRYYQYRVAAINAQGLGPYTSASAADWPHYFRTIYHSWEWDGFWCNYYINNEATTAFGNNSWESKRFNFTGGCSAYVDIELKFNHQDATPAAQCRVGASDHDGWQKKRCEF